MHGTISHTLYERNCLRPKLSFIHAIITQSVAPGGRRRGLIVDLDVNIHRCGIASTGVLPTARSYFEQIHFGVFLSFYLKVTLTPLKGTMWSSEEWDECNRR